MTLTAVRPIQDGILRAGPFWQRFEDLRVGAAQQLSQLSKGVVGTLVLKRQQYRILREDDFQELQGLAADVHRVSDGVELLIRAAIVWKENDTENTRELLAIAIEQMASSPALPRRKAPEAIRLDRVPHDQFSEDEDDSFDFSK
ncbi:hypothetical protein K7W42_07695 [Deinococcus sp. HMF7604]|uniref:hypothetical protein n=1 Tax=Deinococcus betulae TaxID=2873312 RepID=UPI001CCC3761|nr:hypothetical protein [Deinococcus betulae]MBZ9750742.1 hypothetical protein [Deinococcus betulae]